MEFYRKLIILSIVLLTSYMLFRLLMSRWKIQTQIQEQNLPGTESFTYEFDESIIDEPFISGINIQNTANNKLALSQYCVKGSFHTAYNRNTNKIDENHLSTVMSRGVRFVDLEVYSFGGNAVVGYCSKLNPDATVIESANSPDDSTTLLSSIFKTINSAKPPSLTDPLFIHLRFKSKLPAFYTNVLKCIQASFQGVLFSGSIDFSKPLSEYKGKTIIVVDKANSTTNYHEYAGDLNQLVNLETGTTSCSSTLHSTILNSRNNIINTNADNETISIDDVAPTKWMVSMPNPMDTSNPDIKEIIPKHGVNVVLYRFDYDDDNLGKYESVFANNAYVSFVNALQNIKSL